MNKDRMVTYMKKVFIDGDQGTTGLRIFSRLEGYDGIEVVTLPNEIRKDKEARKNAINSCDVAFLCLPDDAARESVSLIENEDVIIIDTSTAHRCDERFAYGFPELGDEFYTRLTKSNRIAVPGCHASGFIALVKPLIEANVISKDSLLSAHSITGYSGGGKKMIADYESDARFCELDAPRHYALNQTHKHLPEMVKMTGLKSAPVFCPVVSDFYSGMLVSIPVFMKQLSLSVAEIKDIYRTKYKDGLVSYSDELSSCGFISSNSLRGKDTMEIGICGNEERAVLYARYDNLGKGASGAAVECLNIKLGKAPEYHLNV